MSIKNVKQQIEKEFYNFFKVLEITKKNNSGNNRLSSKEELQIKKKEINKIINNLLKDIDKYKTKLGFYRHVDTSYRQSKKTIKLYGKDKSIYEMNYGYMFHFISWYIYKLISIKKFEDNNIDYTNNKKDKVTKKIAGNKVIYDFICNFRKNLINNKNNNLLDFLKK